MWDGISWFWFVFSWLLVMSSTFLCTSWPFLYLSWKYIYKYLFKNCYFFFLSHMSSLYILDIIRYIVGKCFLLSHRLSSHFVKFSSQYRSFYFRYSPTYLFLLLLPWLSVSNPKKKWSRPLSRRYCLCFLLGVLWFQVLCSRVFIHL